jgi:hypothetical protein
VARIDNPYLPYRPGTRIHFVGVRGRTRQTDDEVVLRRTRKILGVASTVVRDTVSEHGHAVERTDDWYAQDRAGNVWYRQEYHPSGKVLDEARVLRLTGTLTVPLGSFRHVLETSEFSPLEPQTEHKFCARGVGEIAEHVVKGHRETLQLVSVRH